MPTSDPFEILLTHDKWATVQMLNACAKLSDEQFHKKFEMGRGSLHDNLVHMLSAMTIWTQLLAGQTPGTRIDESGNKYGVPEILKMLETCSAAFEAEARRLPVSEKIVRERGGKTYTFMRGAVVTHVATHGMHHRAQCLNMLRQLGVTPLPPSSVAEWTWMGDGV